MFDGFWVTLALTDAQVDVPYQRLCQRIDAFAWKLHELVFGFNGAGEVGNSTQDSLQVLPNFAPS